MAQEPSSQAVLEWMYDTQQILRGLALEVRRDVGHALRFAQSGEKPPLAKVLSGFGGASVVEVIANHDGDTFRCVYTVRFAGVVYVLHVFQKKSKKGIATPKSELDLVRKRLADAATHYQAHYEKAETKRRKTMSTEESGFVRGSGNVFADLDMPEPGLELAKAELALAIHRVMKQRKLTQARLAAILGDSQPNVSLLTRGRIDSFTYDRLLRHLSALGLDVELTIRPAQDGCQKGHLTVRMA